MKNRILYILIGVIFTACNNSVEKTSRVDVLPYYEDATFAPRWFDSNEEIPQDFHRIPEFDLTNQMGESFTNSMVEGKIYVADFFFTSCPGICPKMTSNMSLIQEAFMDDGVVLLLSHSVTPEYDSVSVLQEYAEIKGVKSEKWHLLTGDRDHIYDLGRNYYFVEEDLGLNKTADDFLHTENFILIDQLGFIRGIYNGLNKAAISQLMADIKTLKQEKVASL